MKWNSHTCITLGLALAGSSSAASTQEPLGGFGGTQSEGYGLFSRAVGDLDGDGVEDVLIGAPNHVPPGAPVATGRAEIVSGATLADPVPTVIFSATGGFGGCAGTGGRSNFGGSGDGGRDITGDGVPDFVVAAFASGSVTVFDGATGLDLLDGTGEDIDGPCLKQHGFRVALFDADGDAHADLLVTRVDTAVVSTGRFLVYSGAWLTNPTGGATKVLYARASALQDDSFGTSVAVLGDLDGDGRDEFAIGASRNSAAFGAGSVAVFSGANGQRLHRFGPAASVGGSRYGSQLAFAGDLDGDGVSDLAVSDHSWPAGPARLGRIEVVSGAWIASGGTAGTRQLLAIEEPPSASIVEIGTSLHAVDANRDGRFDLLAGRRSGAVFGWTLHSGRTAEVMWTFESTQAVFPYTPRSAALVRVPGGDRLVLGAPYEEVSGSLGAGFAYVVRAHDGAGERFAPGIGCPCGNDDPRAGCANALGQGALLAVERGSLSLAAGRLALRTSGMPPNSFGFLVGGIPASPAQVANGLFALTAPIRFPVQQANGQGVVETSGDVLGDFAALAPLTGGAAPMVGVSFGLQYVYRDVECSTGAGSALQFSNGYRIVPRP